MARVSTRYILKNATASYVNVFAPRAKMNATSPEDTEFSVQVVIPKDHPQVAELKKAIAEVAAQAFPKQKLAPQGGPVKVPLRDADAEGKAEGDEFLAGKLFFNARSQYKPQVVDGNLIEITDESQFYSGCRMNVSLTFYAYDTAGSKGIGVALNNIQRIAYGKRLDNRRTASDEFGAVEEDFSEAPSMNDGGGAEMPEEAAPAPAAKNGKAKAKTSAPDESSVSW